MTRTSMLRSTTILMTGLAESTLDTSRAWSRRSASDNSCVWIGELSNTKTRICLPVLSRSMVSSKGVTSSFASQLSSVLAKFQNVLSTWGRPVEKPKNLKPIGLYGGIPTSDAVRVYRRHVPGARSIVTKIFTVCDHLQPSATTCNLLTKNVKELW